MLRQLGATLAIRCDGWVVMRRKERRVWEAESRCVYKKEELFLMRLELFYFNSQICIISQGFVEANHGEKFSYSAFKMVNYFFIISTVI